MRKRRFKILILILISVPVLPLLLIVVFLVCERVRGQISLAHYKRELRSRGEKLTASDLQASASSGENGAPGVLEAAQRLKDGLVLPKSYPPRMKLTPAGRAIVCFREDEWVQEKATNHWDQLSADLAANEAPLQQIRVALEKPVLDNHLDFSEGFKMPLAHLGVARKLTQWFAARSELALHKESIHEALDDLIPQIQLPRLLAEDRVAISELVRIAIAVIAKTSTWEALQADGWTDADLAALQTAWESQNFAASMVHSMEGELVYGDTSFKLQRKSNEETVQVLYGLEEYLPVDESDRPLWERIFRKIPGGDLVAAFLKKQVYCRVWRFAWLDQDERRYLESMQRLLGICRAAAQQKSFASVRSTFAQFEAEFIKKSLYDRLRFPGPNSAFTLSRVVNKGMRAETERSICLCAVALKRYFLRYGKPPASLDSLVPEFVSSVPFDHMDGKQMKYHLNSGASFTLYSVGDNCEDEGGDTSLLEGKTNLQNLWDRKDFVWPSPALPDEIETYRKEARKAAE